MPMIDVTVRAGLIKDRPALTKALAHAMMKWEQVPDIAMFSDNTAAFIHELPPDAFIAETPDGGWGLGGHANTNAEIAAEARRQLGKV